MSEQGETSDAPTKGQLRVTHKDEGDYMARGIKLRLDGRDLTLLKSGKAIVVEVLPGRHRLRIDNTFYPKTIEFDVKANEQIHYRIWNKRGFGSWMVEVLGAGPMYLHVEQAEPVESQSLPITPQT
ncbi:MAG TPA: hypothetical protein VJS44_06645 [Pyrinomonadaceae bacterium]|nr:hypothetical protein [Pyrinomonadaceae bacterium]